MYVRNLICDLRGVKTHRLRTTGPGASKCWSHLAGLKVGKQKGERAEDNPLIAESQAQELMAANYFGSVGYAHLFQIDASLISVVFGGERSSMLCFSWVTFSV